MRCLYVLPFLFSLTLWGQVQVSAPALSFSEGEAFSFQITVGNLNGLAVESYALQLAYDPSIINLNGVTLAGTLSAGINVVTNTEQPGRLIVSAATVNPLSGSGALLNITGTTLALGQTNLSFQSFVFNEGSPGVTLQNGSIEVLGNQFLVSRFGFDGNFNDLSGNSHHALARGSVSFVQGVAGQAVRFDGSEDSFLEIPDHTSFNTPTYTISAWFRAEEAVPAAIIARGESYNTDKMHYALMVNTTTPHQVEGWFEAANDADFFVYSSTRTHVGQWYFAALSRDESGVFKLYINGVLEQQLSGTPPPPSLNHPITIGLRTNVDNGRLIPFQGAVDEVRFYNRALSDQQVQSLFEAVGTAPSTGMVINQGAPTTARTRLDLELFHQDARQIRGFYLSESALVPSGNEGSWVSVTPTSAFHVSGVPFQTGDSLGTKQVFAWFRYGDGSISNAISSTITLASQPAWVAVGEDLPGGLQYLSLDSQDLPWVSLRNGDAHTYRFDGFEWQSVGGRPVSNEPVSEVAMVMDDQDHPFMVFDQGGPNRMSARQWDGSQWLVRGDNITPDSFSWVALGLDPANKQPHVLYNDHDIATSGRLSMLKYQGGIWSQVGNAGFSNYNGADTSIAFSANGLPYVAYRETYETNSWLRVKKFSGTQWQDMPMTGLPPSTSDVKLVTDSAHNLYLAYSDWNLDGRVSVRRFNGTSWDAVGPLGFTGTFTENLYLAVAPDDSLMIVYDDLSRSRHLTARRFNGLDWEIVGEPAFSQAANTISTLAFDSTGTAYVASHEQSGGSAGRVYKYATVALHSLPPEIDLLEPNGQADVVANSYTIVWQDGRAGSNASISLYYDREGPGGVGLIIDGLSENDPNDYHIWNVSQIPNGNYQIFAMIDDGINPARTTYSPGMLTVANPQAVTFTTQPQSATLCAGQSLDLSVLADGTAPITYQWRLNGSDIPNASQAVFHVASVTTQDAGEYYCLATNPLGTTVSAAAYVAVNQLPRILQQPETPIACSGQNLTITVVADGPNLVFQWQKDGLNLAGATQPALFFENIDSSDTGIYRCVISNGCGTLTSWDVPLIVEQSVQITLQPINTYLKLEESLTLRVAASGSQPINYQWYFQSEPIANATGPNLNIAHLRFDDMGFYFCRVSNGCGSLDSSLALVNSYNQELFPTDDVPNTHLGNAVIIEGDLAVIGRFGDGETAANSGAVYVYRRSNGQWSQEARLRPTPPIVNGYFGATLSLYGNRIIVGAPGENSVYIFRNDPSAWVLESRLVGGAGIGFASAVALGNDYAVVGAPTYSGRGGVYLITNSAGVWTQRQIRTPNTAANQGYGTSVAIHGNTVVVGAPYQAVGGVATGAVSIYNFSGSSLGFVSEFVASSLNAGDCFGKAVAIDNEIIVIGANNHDAPTTNIGAAYVFRGGGSSWVEERKLSPTFSTNNQFFGSSVAVGQNRILVGGPGNSSRPGLAHLFEYANGVWYSLKEIIPSVAGTAFGQAVDLSGSTLLIGAPNDSQLASQAGVVYIYEFGSPSSQACPKPLITTHPRSVNLIEGQAHSFEVEAVTTGNASYQWYHNDRPVSGATQPALTLESVSPNHQGVYHCRILDTCDEVLSAAASLTVGSLPHGFAFDIPELESADGLGPVAVSGNRVIIGAPGDDDFGGAAYIFAWDGLAWVREAKLLAPPPSTSFGSAVALAGERAVIRAGSTLHVYHRQAGAWLLRASLVDSIANSGFPADFVIQGNEIMAGADLRDELGSNAGRVLVFKWDGLSWQFSEELPRRTAAANDRIGLNLALSGDHLVLGVSSRSSAIVYRRRNGDWQLETTLATPDYLSGNLFGNGLAINGGLLAIGAPNDDEFASNAGAVYTYENERDQWFWQDKFSSTIANDFFGTYLAMDGQRLLTGVPNHSERGLAAGTAYLYALEDDQWLQRAKYLDPLGKANDQFGQFLDLAGEMALVGTNLADQDGINSGNLLLFLAEGVNVNCLAGDVTANGSVSAFDAAQVLTAAVGLPTDYDPLSPCAADVTCNGTVSAFDAAQILRYTTGLISDLDCAEQPRGGQASVFLELSQTGTVPFSLPLLWRGTNTLSLRLELSYDPQALALIELDHQLPDGWTMAVNQNLGTLIIAVAGAQPLPLEATLLRLQFLPLASGNTSIHLLDVEIDERARPDLNQDLVFELFPCLGGPWNQRLDSWPGANSSLDLISALNCVPVP